MQNVDTGDWHVITVADPPSLQDPLALDPLTPVPARPRNDGPGGCVPWEEAEALRRALADLCDRQGDYPTDLSDRRSDREWREAFDRARALLS